MVANLFSESCPKMVRLFRKLSALYEKPIPLKLSEEDAKRKAGGSSGGEV
jgi:hypothetical protein